MIDILRCFLGVISYIQRQGYAVACALEKLVVVVVGATHGYFRKKLRPSKLGSIPSLEPIAKCLKE